MMQRNTSIAPDSLNHMQMSFRVVTVNNTVFSVASKVFKGTVSRGCGSELEEAASMAKNQHPCTDRRKRIKTVSMQTALDVISLLVAFSPNVLEA